VSAVRAVLVRVVGVVRLVGGGHGVLLHGFTRLFLFCRARPRA
jgi:hypothetical protein